MEFLTAAQMYDYEQHIIEDKQVPSIVLMECAARAIVKQMKKTISLLDKVMIVAGGGNNGGDAIAVGRILHNEGFQVEILIVGNPQHYSEQNILQQKIAESYGTSIKTDLAKVDFTETTAFVEGLFGIGLSRPVQGTALKAIQKINDQHAARTFSIDVPSGISALTGEKIGDCVLADETITFGFYKHGMEKENLKKYFGTITVDDIGFFL